MSSSLVLLPTYNERDNLPGMVAGLSACADSDVLVIDDSSPDGTGDIAEALRGRYPRLSVLHRLAREGLGRAYVHGFRTALEHGYRYVVTMDADLSHDPADVPRLLSALDRGDIAIGSRHSPLGGRVVGWPLWRWVLSRAGSGYSRRLLSLPVWDVTSGFRAYRSSVLGDLDLNRIRARGFVFQAEILYWAKRLCAATVVEVPIVFRNRQHGGSKLSNRIIVEAALQVLLIALRGWRSRGAFACRDRGRVEPRDGRLFGYPLKTS